MQAPTGRADCVVPGRAGSLQTLDLGDGHRVCEVDGAGRPERRRDGRRGVSEGVAMLAIVMLTHNLNTLCFAVIKPRNTPRDGVFADAVAAAG